MNVLRRIFANTPIGNDCGVRVRGNPGVSEAMHGILARERKGAWRAPGYIGGLYCFFDESSTPRYGRGAQEEPVFDIYNDNLMTEALLCCVHRFLLCVPRFEDLET